MRNFLLPFQKKTHEAPIKLFGIFGIVNYPLFYILWRLFPDSRYDDWALRSIATIFCIGLILKEQWPKILAPYFPAYWYLAIIFCIPFMGTYLFLENHASSNWMLNATLGVFLMLFILDWKSFAITLPTGVISATIIYFLINSDVHVIAENFLSTILNISWVIIVAILFSRKKELLQADRQKTLEAAAGAIAHEMRTPLASVSMNGHILKRSVKKIQHYLTDTKQDEDFAESNLTPLSQMANSLITVSKHSNNLINVLLTNLKEEMETLPQLDLSMKDVLQETLKEFVYRPGEEEKVHLSIESEFSFKGNLEIVTHVFYNLLKNSLYFIHTYGAGEIFITLKQGRKGNMVLFKDTGPGIEPKRLPKLFTPFYSRRPHGTGIGLSFCKRAIESMGGTIKVESVLNDHTTFTIILPYAKNI